MKKRHEDTIPATISGSVVQYNFSPRGGIEGMLVDDEGKIVQVNLQPVEEALYLPQIGEKISVAIDPESEETETGDHPVYQAAAYEWPDEEYVRVEGKVARLNFALHGEPNGVVLDNGDFLHLKPEGMKRIDLAIGQRIEAEGNAWPLALGHGRIIETDKVNGVKVAAKK